MEVSLLLLLLFPELLSWCILAAAAGREGRKREALCCKSATCFSLQRFTLQCITPKPCQNNWNANQMPQG